VNKLRSRQDLDSLRARLQAERQRTRKPTVSVCGGTGCRAYGCIAVGDAVKAELARQGMADRVNLMITGCRGFCELGPIVAVMPGEFFYQRVKVEDVPSIITETVVNGRPVESLLYTDPHGKKYQHQSEIPFYRKQHRIIFGNNGEIDPTSLEDYIAIGGYSALSKALFEMKPEDVINEVKASGLRGRGGAGFPTGLKWETTRKAHGDLKYVIANGDEGDPGAYANRSLLEGNPHSVLEGMIIGAFAIGAREGYIYVRNEYPLAVENFKLAIERAEKAGLLGKNILGSGFDFIVTVNRGGGAFVCGESTALMASLEGKAGEPRVKYIHTAEKGLWDRPSNLNNVETWANIPLIINNGSDWFRSIGTKGSTGTKVFSLVGKVNNTGLVEVPMGITLREIIYDIGGGIKDGRKFKAVQTGGPSGGCIPEELIDLPVDFDELTRAGSMMGSGGMIVMDDRTCMVDIAKYFFTFLEEESCGKCVPCREGIKRMRQILTDITEGRGRNEDIPLMERLAATLSDASLCQLGATAPNPVLTTLKYFREEYEAHIRDKKCPAGVCKALIKYYIITDKCVGCQLCVKACPNQAITGQGKKKPVVMDQSKCIKCGACHDVCKFSAVGID